jgi:hypothetical protein
MSKDTFYFSHDYNARLDEKIKRLIKKHGMTGYGIFWAIVEDLYNNANALRTHYDDIAYDFRVDSETVKSVINDFGLFHIKNGFFGSASISRRIDARNEKSAKARESAFRRWGKNANASKKNANASKNDAIKERKGNKGKDSIGKKHVFIPPALDEVKAYFKENGYTEEAALKAFNHYDAGNWHDVNGNQVLSWKQKVVTNWFTEENKICAKRRLVMP